MQDLEANQLWSWNSDSGRITLVSPHVALYCPASLLGETWYLVVLFLIFLLTVNAEAHFMSLRTIYKSLLCELAVFGVCCLLILLLLFLTSFFLSLTPSLPSSHCYPCYIGKRNFRIILFIKYICIFQVYHMIIWHIYMWLL